MTSAHRTSRSAHRASSPRVSAKGSAARAEKAVVTAPPPPKSIKVGHAVFRVDSADLDDNYGLTYTRDTRIAYTPRQSRSNLRDTLLHESLHAIFDTAGVTRGEGNALVSQDTEESLVAILSPWILGLLRENPDLVAFLLAEA